MSQNELSNRLKFLVERDIEKLQEEFLKTNNERNLSVKNIKKEKSPNATNKTNKDDSNNLILTTNLNSDQTKIRKKKKDIITLDINITDSKYSTTQLNTKKENESIFKSAKDQIDLIKEKGGINKETGLPDTFKVESKPKSRKIEDKREKGLELKLQPVIQKQEIIEKIANVKINNDEYKQIHDKNLELINSLNKEQLIEYQQTIKSKIPEKLLEKMKQGFFQKKFVEQENVPHTIENEIEDESEEENEINLEKDKDEDKEKEIIIKDKQINLEKPTKEKETLIFVNYEGKIKISDLNTNNQPDLINYSKLKYKDIDLESKFFSLKEIQNLLMSTSEQQVTLGLKLSNVLITDKNLFLSDQVSKLKLWNIFYFLIDNRNLNIKTMSMNNLITILNLVFYSDFKNFKTSFFYLNNFPGFKINLSFDDNKDKILNIIKAEILSSFNKEENIHKSVIFAKSFLTGLLSESIKYQDNYVLNFFTFVFYCFYLSDNFIDVFKNSELEAKLKKMIIDFKIIFCGKNFALENYAKFRKICSKILIMILLESFNIEDYSNIISEFEDNSKINFIKALKTGQLNQEFIEKILNDSNRKPIDVNCLMKFINEKNLSENLQMKNFDFNIENFNFDEKFVKKLNLVSRSLLTKIKIFKYSLISEDFEYCILNNKNELSVLENLFQKSLNYLNKILASKDNYSEKLLNFIEINPIYDFLNTVALFSHISTRYPKAIKYLSTIDISIIQSIIPALEEISNFYSKIIQKEASQLLPNVSEASEDKNQNYSENFKFQFLYLTESFTKLNLNIVKHLQIYSKISLTNILLTIPNFLNTNCEAYYNKYLKYLTYHFNKKIRHNEHMQKFIQKINFSFDILLEDLNLYLNSNEDLRKSKYLKNFMNEENLNFPLFKQNSKSSTVTKSKFFPFNKHFILQILYNDKINSEVKLNYMVLLTVICNGEKINTSTFNFFEIILRTLLKYKDVINENKAEFIFAEFIKILVMPNYKNLFLKKTQDMEIFMEIFFNKFECEAFNEIEISFAYKFLLLFLILIHNPNNSYKENCYSLSVETLATLFYAYFLQINNKFSLDQLKFIDGEEILAFISENLSIKNVDIYLTLIMTYFKNYIQNVNDFNKETFLIKLIKMIILKLDLVKNLDDKSEIRGVYQKYIEMSGNGIKEIRDKIYEKINKK